MAARARLSGGDFGGMELPFDGVSLVIGGCLYKAVEEIDGVWLVVFSGTVPVEVDLAPIKAERVALLQHEIRAYVDAIVPQDVREMLNNDLLRSLRGRPVSAVAVAQAEAVESFTLRARGEGDRVAAACASCVSAEDIAAVSVDYSAIGVP